MYGKTNPYGGVRRGNSRQMKKYTARNGATIWLDISPEAFRRAGFEKIRHGDTIRISTSGDLAIAIGFNGNNYLKHCFWAPEMFLWYKLPFLKNICFSILCHSNFEKIEDN